MIPSSLMGLGQVLTTILFRSSFRAAADIEVETDIALLTQWWLNA
ncbi:hypothetical protein [Vibrio tubiashii]